VKAIEDDWGKFHIGKLKYLPLSPSTNVIIISWEMCRSCGMPGKMRMAFGNLTGNPERKGCIRKT
jgi:hypothetical protein